MGHEILSMRGVMMRSIATLALGATLMLLGASAALAVPITVCGTLQALTRNVPPDSPGSATIDGRTFILTSALSTDVDRTNRVEADVRVGQRVCLTGDLSNPPGPGGNRELFQNFVLASCSGSAAPSSCVQSLPSTATGPAQWPSGAATSNSPAAVLFGSLGPADAAARWAITLAGPALVAAVALRRRRVPRSN